MKDAIWRIMLTSKIIPPRKRIFVRPNQFNWRQFPSNWKPKNFIQRIRGLKVHSTLKFSDVIVEKELTGVTFTWQRVENKCWWDAGIWLERIFGQGTYSPHQRTWRQREGLSKTEPHIRIWRLADWTTACAVMCAGSNTPATDDHIVPSNRSLCQHKRGSWIAPRGAVTTWGRRYCKGFVRRYSNQSCTHIQLCKGHWSFRTGLLSMAMMDVVAQILLKHTSLSFIGKGAPSTNNSQRCFSWQKTY